MEDARGYAFFVVARSPDRATGSTEGLQFQTSPGPAWHGRETIGIYTTFSGHPEVTTKNTKGTNVSSSIGLSWKCQRDVG